MGPDSTFRNLGVPSSAFISHIVLLQNMESCPCVGVRGGGLCKSGSMLVCHSSELRCWDVSPCCLVRTFQRSKHTCCHLHFRRKRLFYPEVGKSDFLETSLPIKLHGVICQKTVILIWDPRISYFNRFSIYPKLICFSRAHYAFTCKKESFHSPSFSPPHDYSDHFPKPLEVPAVATSGGNDFVNRAAARDLCPSLWSPLHVRTVHM